MLVIALVSIYPVVHDWIYKNVNLTIEVKSEAAVISKNLPIDNLNLSYKGKSIDALTRVILEVRNSGRTPITSSDVINPLIISFKNSDILEANLTKVNPSNLEVSVLKDSSKKLKVLFTLLNPEDKAYIDILLLGADSNFEAQARIKNLDNVALINSSQDRPKDNSWYEFSGLIAFLIGAFFLFIGIVEFIPSIKTLKVIETFRNGDSSYLNATTKLEAYKTLNKELKRFPTNAKLNVWEIIGDENFPLSTEAQANTIARIAKIKDLDKGELILNFLSIYIVLFAFGFLLVSGFYPIVIDFFRELKL